MFSVGETKLTANHLISTFDFGPAERNKPHRFCPEYLGSTWTQLQAQKSELPPRCNAIGCHQRGWSSSHLCYKGLWDQICEPCDIQKWPGILEKKVRDFLFFKKRIQIYCLSCHMWHTYHCRLHLSKPLHRLRSCFLPLLRMGQIHRLQFCPACIDCHLDDLSKWLSH